MPPRERSSLLRGDTHDIHFGEFVIGGRGWGVSKCSGRPIFPDILLVRNLPFGVRQ